MEGWEIYICVEKHIQTVLQKNLKKEDLEVSYHLDMTKKHKKDMNLHVFTSSSMCCIENTCF